MDGIIKNNDDKIQKIKNQEQNIIDNNSKLTIGTKPSSFFANYVSSASPDFEEEGSKGNLPLTGQLAYKSMEYGKSKYDAYMSQTKTIMDKFYNNLDAIVAMDDVEQGDLTVSMDKVKKAQNDADNQAREHANDINNFLEMYGDKLTLNDKLLSGMVEEFSNPLNYPKTIASAYLGASTPLFAILADSAVETGQLMYENRRFENRETSKAEIALSVAMNSVVPMLSYGYANIKGKSVSNAIGGELKIKQDIPDGLEKANIFDTVEKTRDLYGNISEKVSEFENPITLDTKNIEKMSFNQNKATRELKQSVQSTMQKEGRLKPNKNFIDSYNFETKRLQDTYNFNVTDKTTSVDIKIDPIKSFTNQQLQEFEAPSSSVFRRKILMDSAIINEVNKYNVDGKAYIKVVKKADKRRLNPRQLKTKGSIYNKARSLNNITNTTIDDVFDNLYVDMERYKTAYGVKNEVPQTYNWKSVKTYIDANVTNKYQANLNAIKHEKLEIGGYKDLRHISEDLGFTNETYNLSKAYMNTGDFSFTENVQAKNMLKSFYDDKKTLTQLEMRLRLTDVDVNDRATPLMKRGNFFDEEGNIVYSKEMVQEVLKSPTLFKNFEQDFNFIDELKYHLEGDRIKNLDLSDENVTKAFDLINKENAIMDSIFIDKIVNKNKALYKFQSYFSDRLRTGNVKKARLIDVPRFEKEIVPLFDEGIFVIKGNKKPTLEQMENHFKEFILEYKNTRKDAKLAKKYRSVYSLEKDFMSEGGLKKFFSKDTELLYDDKMMLHRMFNVDTKNMATFLSFGTTSPFGAVNNVKFRAKRIATESFSRIGKDNFSSLGGGGGSFVDKTSQLMQNRMENLLGITKKDKGLLSTTLDKVGKPIRAKVLGFTGINEFISTYPLAWYKASQFDSNFFSPKYFIERHQLNRFNKRMQNVEIDSFTGRALRERFNAYSGYRGAKQELATKVRNTEFYKGKTGKLGEYYNEALDTAMFFQKVSDDLVGIAGDSKTNKVFYNLPWKYDLLDNDTKLVFKANGITENNYFNARKTIYQNMEETLTVDVPKLMRNMEYTDGMEDAIVRSYMQIQEQIGKVQMSQFMKNGDQSPVGKLSTMFTHWASGFTMDFANRLRSYTLSNGTTVNRLGKEYLTTLAPKEIAYDMKTGAIGGGMLALFGLGDYFIGDSIKKAQKFDGTLTEKKDVFIQKFNLAYDNIIGDRETFFDFLGAVVVNTANRTPIVTSGSDAYNLIGKEVKGIYDTFTDEELKTLGENDKEALKRTIETSLSFALSDVLTSFRASEGYEGIAERIGRLTKEEKEKIYARVSDKKTKENANIFLNKIFEAKKAENDYFNGITDSYDELENDVSKREFESKLNNANISDNEKNDLRAEYAVIKKSSNDDLEFKTNVREFLGTEITTKEDVLTWEQQFEKGKKEFSSDIEKEYLERVR